MKTKKDEKQDGKPETPTPPTDPTPQKKPLTGSLEDYKRMEVEAEARAKAEGRESLIGLF